MKLEALASLLGGVLHGDGSLEVARPVHPAEARLPTDVAVAMAPALLALLGTTPARAAIVAAGAPVPEGAVAGWVEVGRPRRAMGALTRAFEAPPHAPPGVHPSAVVEAGAEIGEGASVGAFAWVGPGARIGARTVLMPHVTVGAGASVGADGLLHPGVRVGPGCRIGDRAIVHHNASIGADGFSFVTPERGSVEEAKASGTVAEGTRNVAIERIASLAPVVVGDDVEIGAGTCIDRGTLSPTRIGSGTKIDNLVQVGHNVRVGENCMICGQVGIAGSARIGDRVVLAGQVGVADNVVVGDDVVAGAQSGIAVDVPARSVVVGSPAIPKQAAFDQLRLLRRLPRIAADVAALKGAGGGANRAPASEG
jgi:UDP-3-O-[3-hydroxymyristoyl] glucosamine N-acyltransferase